eukprot:884938_1
MPKFLDLHRKQKGQEISNVHEMVSRNIKLSMNGTRRRGSLFFHLRFRIQFSRMEDEAGSQDSSAVVQTALKFFSSKDGVEYKVTSILKEETDESGTTTVELVLCSGDMCAKKTVKVKDSECEEVEGFF